MVDAKWVNCSLTNEPLAPPVAVDILGNLFNMEPLAAAVEGNQLPEKFRHIKGSEDILGVEMELSCGGDGSGGIFRCPVMGVEANGDYKFFALKSCGHVVSEMGLLRSSHCRFCGKRFRETDKIVINGSDEEVAIMRRWLAFRPVCVTPTKENEDLFAYFLRSKALSVD